MNKSNRELQPINNRENTIINALSKLQGQIQEYLKNFLYRGFWLYMTLLAILLMRPFVGNHYHLRRFNLIPFKTITLYIKAYSCIQLSDVVYNLLGNILILIPFGFLLPRCFEKGKSVLTISLYTFLISFIAELWQIVFKVGIFDIDDILLNVLGGIIGFFIYKIIYKKNV